MLLLKRKSALLAMMFIATVAVAQDTSNALYLKASAQIRNGEFAEAKVLLERILKEFPDDEVAITADSKLNEILAQANEQLRSRRYRTGYGVYVITKDGKSHPLPAYKVTLNNYAAESGRAEDGVIRALSVNTPSFERFILTDIDNVVLYTDLTDLSVFRNERLKTIFPYTRLTDNGEVVFSSSAPEEYLLDVSQLASQYTPSVSGETQKGTINIALSFGGKSQVEKSSLEEVGTVGVSGPLTATPNATFVSQVTGTWGKNPGPVVNVVWPMSFVRDYGEHLNQTTRRMDPQERIAKALELLEQQPKDPSIECFIVEQQANMGNASAYVEWSRRLADKASECGLEGFAMLAADHLKWGKIVLDLDSLMTTRDIRPLSDDERVRLEAYSQSEGRAHIADYLLSLDSERQGDLVMAVESIDRAQKKVDKQLQFVSYCGLLGHQIVEPNDAANQAKKLYKERKKALKRSLKQQKKK